MGGSTQRRIALQLVPQTSAGLSAAFASGCFARHSSGARAEARQLEQDLVAARRDSKETDEVVSKVLELESVNKALREQLAREVRSVYPSVGPSYVHASARASIRRSDALDSLPSGWRNRAHPQ
jgi:hypothetical protein